MRTVSISRRPPTPTPSVAQLRQTVANHVADGPACAACQYRYTAADIGRLCPTAVTALRHLGAGHHIRSVAHYSSAALHSMARQHQPTPSGRQCRRCGLPYHRSPTGPPQCPTQRAIHHELDSRNHTPTPSFGTTRATCAGHARLWEVDGNTSHSWARAIHACRACPLLQSCRTELDRMIATDTAPTSMIMAGVLLTAHSHQIEDLTELRHFATRRIAVTKRTRVRQSKTHQHLQEAA